jgi:NADPH2:quinone reductase
MDPMQSLRLTEKASDPDAIRLKLEDAPDPRPEPGQLVVAIEAAGVNPSDGAAALGRMPQAVWPRTPGRDWAGTVVAGPSHLIGKAVFGTGGDVGITRDGSHATHLVLPEDAVVLRPDRICTREAGTLGVPFVTAWEGFSRAGMPRAGEIVLVLAANGKVGQAAVQIAAMCGARVFGAVRRAEEFAGPAGTGVMLIDASSLDVAATVRDATGGHGADIAFNTVGSPYFAAANQAMAHGARQILIATQERPVPFDIFTFYRGRHSYFGIDTLALDAVASAAALRAMLPGFASGALRPFPVVPDACYGLNRAQDAYRRVLGGTRDRVMLLPGASAG